MFKNVVSWADGKKTYITIALGLLVAGLQAFHVPIPWYVDFGLGFLGLGAYRLSVAKQTKLAQDTLALLQAGIAVYGDVKGQIDVPTLGKPTDVPQESESNITANLNMAQAAQK